MTLFQIIGLIWFSIGAVFGIAAGITIAVGSFKRKNEPADSTLLVFLSPFLITALGPVIPFIFVIVFLYNIHGPNPVTNIIVTPDEQGYWLRDRRARYIPFGTAAQHPLKNARWSTWAAVENAAAVIRPDTGRLLTPAGFPNLGDPSSRELKAPIADIIITGSGEGYWMVSEDGSVYAYGDATDCGSVLNPVDFGLSWHRKPWRSQPFGRTFSFPQAGSQPITESVSQPA